jgi:hypothetical protein
LILRLALAFLALTLPAFAGGDSIESRINRAAFSLARYSEHYEPVPEAVELELRKRFEQALDPIRIAPASWFHRSFGIAPGPGDRRRILESVGDIEIWRCRDRSCPSCGDSLLGCARGKPASGGTGVVATIHPCLYGKAACPTGTKPDIDAWIERVIAGTAFHKAGLRDQNGSLRKALAASSAWIA